MQRAFRLNIGLFCTFLLPILLTQPSPAKGITLKIAPLSGQYQGIKFSTGPISITEEKWQVLNVNIESENNILKIPKILGLNRKKTLELKGTMLLKGNQPLQGLKIPWKAIISKEQNYGKLKAYPTLNNLGLEIVLKWPGPPGFEWEAKTKPVPKAINWSKGLDIAVEQLMLDSQLNLFGNSWDFSNIMGKLFIKIPKGQALYSPWFLDFSKYPFELNSQCLFKKPEIIINNLRLNWILNGKIKNLNIKNFKLLQKRIDPKKIIDNSSWEYFSFNGYLKDLYTVFIKEPFSDIYPILGNLDIEGKAKTELQKNKVDVEISASLFWHQTPAIEKLKIHAPIPLSKENCFDGAVSWEKALIPGMPELYIEPVHIPLKVCYKSAELGPAEMILKPDGALSIQRIYVDFAKSTAYAIQVNVPKVQLKKLFPSLPWKGVFQASFERISYKNGRFDFSGHVKISIGDGTINISNIWLAPSGALPRWGADITFSGLELADLTKQTSFGYMTGKIRGYVKGLVMSGIEPEAFDMLIETDPNSKGKKKISAEAVESLSIIGGGAGIPLIGRFFKTYSYSKIGIHCTLKNDIFTLRGLIKKGNIEYLVKRGFPFGVDVINRNPEGKISFRDMLDRLKRIGSQEETTKE